MPDAQANTMVNKYEDFVYLFFGLLGFALFIWSANDISNIVNPDVTISLFVAFLIIAVMMFLLVGVISLRKQGQFPLSKKFLTAALLSLLTIPLFGVSAVVGANAYWGQSTPVIRTQEIIDKYDSHVTRKNRDYYYLYVRPWRNNQGQISVRVDAKKYDSINVGSYITFKTSTGIFGIEYFIDGN